MNNKMAINAYLSTIKSFEKTQNKQTNKTEIESDTENILMISRWEGVWEGG